MNLPEKNPLEWAVFAASVALIGAMIGTLIQFERRRPDTPPELFVRTTAARPSGDGFAVGVLVENRGGETAENAVIEVEMTGGGATPERSQLHLAFVPHGSVRSGDVIFSRDPAAGTLRARVLGYERR